MAVPPNTTPATATAIAANALPYVAVVSAADLSDTPTGSGYPSTCDTTQYKALWWTVTTGPAQTFLSLTLGAGGASSSPVVSVWTGPLAALVPYTLGGQLYCADLVGSYWLQLTLTPNTRYYLQVTDFNVAPADAALVLELRAGPALPAPGGSVVVPSEDPGIPAVIMDAVTGTPLRVVDLPATVLADTLPGCFVAVQPLDVSGEVVRLYHGDLATVVGSVTIGAGLLRGIKSNRHQRMYFIAEVGAAQTVGWIDQSAVYGGTTWTLPINSALAKCYAVTQDDTILYYGSRTASAVLHAYDLVHSVALPDLHAAFGTEWLSGFGDGIALVDGSVIFGYSADVLGTTGLLRRIDAAGTVLHTYTLGATFALFNRYCYVDEYSFLAWGYASVSQSVFRLIKISDGSTIHEWQVESIGTGGGASTTPVPSSLGGALFVLPYSLGPDGTVGSLIDPGSGGCGLPAPAAPLPAPAGPATMPETAAFRIRRVRVCPHLADATSHKMAFYSRFALVCQAGQAPLTYQIRFSTDGGATWGPQLSRTTGLGQYASRVVVNRLPRARDLLIEVVNSDDAVDCLLDGLIEVTLGTS